MRGDFAKCAFACAAWLIGALLAMALTTGSTQAYSCGDPSSSHCYGVAQWQEHPEYFGAYSDIPQVAMGCPSGCGGFVDDETWLVDDQTAGCKSNSFGMCWLEAGYFFTDGSSNAQFFWADSRPLSSSTFNLHILGQTDPVGVVDHFMIIKDARGASGIFQVWLYNDSLSTLYNGTSTSNAMSGHKIIIGQELAGTKNASAGSANFTRNIWAVQTLGPEYVFWYKRQINKGSVTSDNPPSASWTIDPASPPPPEGGQFTTSCCN
jgi:hypothetical protein